jgi:hypothetical protein
VDRDLAQRNVRSGLLTASLAVAIFGLAFFVAMLYII